MINQKIDGTSLTVIDYEAFSKIVSSLNGKYTIAYLNEHPSYKITIDGVEKLCNITLNLNNMYHISKREFEALALSGRNLCILAPIECGLRFAIDTAFGKKGDEIKFEKDGGNFPDDILEIFGLKISSISEENRTFSRVGEGSYIFIINSTIL